MLWSRRTEALDVLVLSPVFKTGVGCEEHLGQVRFLCASADPWPPAPVGGWLDPAIVRPRAAKRWLGARLALARALLTSGTAWPHPSARSRC